LATGSAVVKNSVTLQSNVEVLKMPTDWRYIIVIPLPWRMMK